MSRAPEEKLNILGPGAQLDLCQQSDRPMPDGDGSAGGLARAEQRYHHGDVRRHITTAQHPARGPIPVLRVLQTNACAKDCYYCPFRAGRAFRREAYRPEELARLTDELHRARLIQGLFLSSGVVGRDDHSMAQIVATAEILRRRHRPRPAPPPPPRIRPAAARRASDRPGTARPTAPPPAPRSARRSASAARTP